MNGSTLDPHAGLLFVNNDGSVNFFHSSSSGNGLSRREDYNTTNLFQRDFAYNYFYYQLIQ